MRASRRAEKPVKLGSPTVCNSSASAAPARQSASAAVHDAWMIFIGDLSETKPRRICPIFGVPSRQILKFDWSDSQIGLAIPELALVFGGLDVFLAMASCRNSVGVRSVAAL